MKLIRLVTSGEFFFAAFLLAGYFKGGISWFPIDVTIFFLGLTLLVAARRFLQNPEMIKNSVKSFILFLVLSAVIIVSYFYSDSIFYAQEKLLRFVVITAWSFVGVFFLLKTEESIKKFLYSVALIGSVVALVALVELFSAVVAGRYNGTIFIMDTDYLALGRTVGLGIVCLICLKWFSSVRAGKMINASILVMLISLSASGAKMPIIATVISLIFVVLLTTKIKKEGWTLIYRKGTKKLSLLLSVFLIALVPASFYGFAETMFRRLNVLFTGTDQSASERLYLYDTALLMIKNNPIFGAGWATFPLYFYGTDEKVYPHNIFLEIYSELGVFGLISFLILLVFAVVQGFIVYKKEYAKYSAIQLALIGSFVFFFLNANTSGDITDNKILFTFIALLCISPYFKGKQEITDLA